MAVMAVISVCRIIKAKKEGEKSRRRFGRMRIALVVSNSEVDGSGAKYVA